MWRTLLVKNAEFPRAVLRGIDLSGLYAPGVSLVAADLSHSDFSNAALVGARLDGVRALGTRFSGALLDDAVLAGAVLTKADFTGAHLEGADLKGAAVEGANFSKAGFFHADLRGVDLRRANLEGVDTRYTCFDDSTKWPFNRIPTVAFCKTDESPAPLAGAQYSIDVSLLDSLRPNGATQLYTKKLELHGRKFVLSLQFENLGVAPLQSVSILVVLPSELKVVPLSVTLRNADNPTGYVFGPDASQQDQVHVGIGDYLAGSNAFLEMEVVASDAACGKGFDIKAYATPRRLGSIVDAAHVSVAC